MEHGAKVETIEVGEDASAKAPDVNRMKIHGQEFDFCISCTYNQSFPAPLADYEFWYEVCAFPVAVFKEAHDPLSFGFFNGPFPSVEPYLFKGPLPERFRRIRRAPIVPNLARQDCCVGTFQERR
jgi:hypothetical protein